MNDTLAIKQMLQTEPEGASNDFNVPGSFRFKSLFCP
jgi:hypothetical protein